MKGRKLFNRNKLKPRAEEAMSFLNPCHLCPRECGVDRLKGEEGYCHSVKGIKVSSFGPHFGEEPPLVGRNGSGTIFFTNCNLRCLYCQNYDISHLGQGREISYEELGGMMISLQEQGCHNINLVTPTHLVPQILQALIIAIKKGLDIPLVYNCSGYESLSTLYLLEDIIDIYMPDAKYGLAEAGEKYSGVKDYPERMKAAVKEMHCQVGDLVVDEEGIAQQGLLIRHLILPNGLAGTREVLSFIAREISRDSYVNIMDQYHPEFKAHHFPEINRPISRRELEETIKLARQLGLHRGF